MLRATIIAQYILENTENYKIIIDNMFQKDFYQLSKYLVQNSSQKQAQGIGTSIQKYELLEDDVEDDILEDDQNSEEQNEGIISQMIQILEQWDQPINVKQIIQQKDQQTKQQDLCFKSQIPNSFTQYYLQDKIIKQQYQKQSIMQIHNVQFIDPNNVLPFQVVIPDSEGDLFNFSNNNTYKSVLESLENACFQNKLLEWYEKYAQNEDQLKSMIQNRVFLEYLIIQQIQNYDKNNRLFQLKAIFQNPILSFFNSLQCIIYQVYQELDNAGLNVKDQNQILESYDRQLQVIIQSFISHIEDQDISVYEILYLLFKYIPLIKQVDLQFYCIFEQILIEYNKYHGINDDLIVFFYQSYINTILLILYSQKPINNIVQDRIERQMKLLNNIQIKKQNSKQVNICFAKLLILLNQVQYQFGIIKMIKSNILTYQQLIDQLLTNNILEPLKYCFTNVKITLNQDNFINQRINLDLIPLQDFNNLCYIKLVQETFIQFETVKQYYEKNQGMKQYFCPFCFYQTNHHNCIGEDACSTKFLFSYNIQSVSNDTIQLIKYFESIEQKYWQLKDFAILLYNFNVFKSFLTQFIYQREAEKKDQPEDYKNANIQQPIQGNTKQCIESTQRIHNYGLIW